MNPLAWIVRRWPRPFGLAWVEDVTYVRTGERTYDERPVRYLATLEAETDGWEFTKWEEA